MDPEMVEFPDFRLPSPSLTVPVVEVLAPEPQPRSSPIDWDGDDDTSNPQNWTITKKWRIVALLSMMGLMTSLASTTFAPAVPQVMKEFHSTSTVLATFVVSIFVLGFAVGPLLAAPLSEIYGRRPVYLISNVLFVVFTMICAVSSSVGMLTGFRFLAGCAGSTFVTLGGATIGDMFTKEKRGKPGAIWGAGPLLGPALGPMIGGVVAQWKGWRWTFWLQLAFAGIALLLGVAALEETYAAVILQAKMQRLIAQTGDPGKRSIPGQGTTVEDALKRAITRPLRLLWGSPVVSLTSIYVALVYGYLYLLITSLPIVFQEQYGFSTGTSGLVYLGLGGGAFIGLIVVSITSDKIYSRLVAQNHGVSKPEFRLPLVMVTGPLVVVALLWYGWSIQKGSHWIMPIIGTAIFGLALMPAFVSTTMYLIEIYTRYSASAIAAVRLLQCLGGTFLPLAATPLYTKLGFGWGNSMLAVTGLLVTAIPVVLFRYGEKIRVRYPIRR